MYKGKFDQKSKNTTSDIQELIAQRNAAPAKPQPKAAPKGAPQNRAHHASQAPTRPASGRPAAPASREQAARAQRMQPMPQSAPQKKKKGPRTGGVIFYTLYFLFILVFFVGTYIGLTWLHGWLGDYEAAQPTAKAQQVFEQLFSNPDWSALYEATGAQDSPYEGKEEFVSFMQSRIDPAQLTYLETSAGLSGDKKYEVRLGEEVIATFTLVDQNTQADNALGDLGAIPDWQLGKVDVKFQREGTYRIQVLEGHTAYVNDVALDESFTIQKATTLAADYLPEGVTGFRMCTQEITGLMIKPTVTVFDEKGTQMEVSYNEETKTFVENVDGSSAAMTEDQKSVALQAAETYCLYMIERAGRTDIAKYFDPTSDVYKTITGLGDLWMQGNSGYEFQNQSVSDFASYSDSLFSAHVSLDLVVTRTDGTKKDYDFDQTLFFQKSDTGKWQAYAMTNKDVSLPKGQVRLTFMQDDTVLVSNFYDTDAKEIVTPLISNVPAGKVFAGWVREDVDDYGKTTLTLVFQPDSEGKVTIPDGTTLVPMTLKAYFENAGAAAQQPATETTAATTPPTTEGA